MVVTKVVKLIQQHEQTVLMYEQLFYESYKSD